jgi:hypothetical protein
MACCPLVGEIIPGTEVKEVGTTQVVPQQQVMYAPPV